MPKNTITVGSIVGLLNVIVIILNNYLQVAGHDQVALINLILAIANGVIVYLSGDHFLRQPSPTTQTTVITTTPEGATPVGTPSPLRPTENDRSANNLP